MGIKYPFKYRSWTLLSSDIAVKEVDRSALIHGGSGIPKEISHFFNTEDLGIQQKHDIVLELFGVKHNRHIVNKLNNRTQMSWNAEFQKEVQSNFPEHYDYIIDNVGEQPETGAFIVFHRKGEDHYIVTFENQIKNVDITPSLPKDTVVRRALERQVKESKRDKPEERRERLAKAHKKPSQFKATTVQFKRNPDVIVEVLNRANGFCECCKSPAPFNRKSDGTPYLEVHHTIPLAKGGDDTVENAEALCPNCHRMKHFG